MDTNPNVIIPNEHISKCTQSQMDTYIYLLLDNQTGYRSSLLYITAKMKRLGLHRFDLPIRFSDVLNLN